MLVEQQIEERRSRAKDAVAKILARPAGSPFGDYQIKSSSGRAYKVSVRGTGLFENYCSCPDFAVNTLGTCKHIEGMLARLHRSKGRAVQAAYYKRTRASLSLSYGDALEVVLRLPAEPSAQVRALGKRYFDQDGRLPREQYRHFGEIMEALRQADDHAVVYSDVLEYVGRENEIAGGIEWERSLLKKLKREPDPLHGLLKAKLLPYQAGGAAFLASRGRGVLADDMGLGKTVQALAAAELLRRRAGIERVLIVAPASVKYQWKTEIEKFSDLPAQIIDGHMAQRLRLYAAPTFFNLTSYELALKDIGHLHELRPDLIILDEAQRIWNWTTATGAPSSNL